MSKIGEGTVHVYTFRAGLLGRVGHDLRLSLERFEFEFEEGSDPRSVDATFWPESLSVEGAMVEGDLDREGLSGSDRRKIRGNIRRDVLQTDEYPEATFSGAAESLGEDRWRVDGELELVGQSRPLSFEVRRQQGRFRTRVELTPTRWGIPPYKALMGALRLEDRVVVEVDVPAE